jgi:hypothetical protein
LRVGLFEFLQLAQQGIVFPVGDLGLRFFVVELVVMGDLSPEIIDA